MYCSPPATGPPTPSLNGGSIFASAPPRRRARRRCATDDAHAELRGRPRLALPADAHLARKSSPGGVDSVTRSSPCGAVVADGGGADQHARARVGRAQAGDEVARAGLARVAGCARCACALQRWATCSPARWTTASRPASAAAGRRLRRRPRRPRRPRRAPRRAPRVAREDRDLVAALAQRAHEPGADEAGGAGQHDLIGQTLAFAQRPFAGCRRWFRASDGREPSDVGQLHTSWRTPWLAGRY